MDYINFKNEKRRKRNPLNLKFENPNYRKISKEKIQNSFSFKKKLNITFNHTFFIPKRGKKIEIQKKQIIRQNLLKHNNSPNKYNKYIINGFIFDGKSNYISKFKDLLFWNDEIECFKKFYLKKESKLIIKKFINFYNKVYNFLNIYPIFFRIGDCKDVMIGNYRRKYRYQNEIKELKNEKKKISDKKKENNFLFLKDILMEDHTHEKKISQSFNLSNFSPNELLNQNNHFDDILNIRMLKKLNTRNIYNKNIILSNSFDTIKSIVRNLSKNKNDKNKDIDSKLFKIKIKNVDYIKRNILKKKNLKIRNIINNNFNNNTIKLIEKKKITNNNSKNVLKSISGNNLYKKLPYLTNGNSRRTLKNKIDNYIQLNNNFFTLNKEEPNKFKYHSSRVSPLGINKNIRFFQIKKSNIKKINII